MAGVHDPRGQAGGPGPPPAGLLPPGLPRLPHPSDTEATWIHQQVNPLHTRSLNSPPWGFLRGILELDRSSLSIRERLKLRLRGEGLKKVLKHMEMRVLECRDAGTGMSKVTKIGSKSSRSSQMDKGG